jgi:hypothetical protein
MITICFRTVRTAYRVATTSMRIFPLAPGASLVASWHDYTPTSALDIALDEAFANME